MDKTHREFIILINQLAGADSASFRQGFTELIRHTQAHFASELLLMQASHFPALREHEAEHQRILGDLQRIDRRLAAGSTLLGRAYVKEHLPRAC